MRRFKTLILSVLASIATAVAQNPYLPLWEFIPDGEPYVFEDPDKPGEYRVYIYGSHDMLRKNYCGRDLVVWSAPVNDLSRWRYDGVIFESKRDRDGKLLNGDGSGDVLYAPDVAVKEDGKGRKVYYLYPNVQSDERGTMVAKAYRPDGPFEVCNWSKDNARRTTGILRFDPAAFVDDDGRAYAYWGFTKSHGAELDTATMATLKPG
nr:family 43 glycosylhydrolase [Prevotella sp.]